mmetsp:Transcript_10497/g.30694  ORF Transcript_10497/g.30694 Transcript_10497/m.30694 type:complete len:275 (-) Transcript_10497:777-1601(-)
MPPDLRAGRGTQHGAAVPVSTDPGNQRGRAAAGLPDLHSGEASARAVGLLRQPAHDGRQRRDAPGEPGRGPHAAAPDRRAAPVVGLADSLLFGNLDRHCGLVPAQERNRRGLRPGRQHGKCRGPQSSQGRLPPGKPPGSSLDEHRSDVVGGGFLCLVRVDVHLHGGTHESPHAPCLLDQLGRPIAWNDLDFSDCGGLERPGGAGPSHDGQWVAADCSRSGLFGADLPGERGDGSGLPVDAGGIAEFLRRSPLRLAGGKFLARGPHDQCQHRLRS